jgi:tetratricopeptide (TPR) repeat protein
MSSSAVIEKGIGFAREGEFEKALKVFDQDLCFTQHPTAMSYYAVCLANVEANFDKAISLCLMAAEKEFYNPDIYLNLGRIFLLNGQKAVAVRAFRKGLKFDESHFGLLSEMRKLGVRRRPVIGFLHRTNPVNKFLGIIADRVVV